MQEFGNYFQKMLVNLNHKQSKQNKKKTSQVIAIIILQNCCNSTDVTIVTYKCIFKCYFEKIMKYIF